MTQILVVHGPNLNLLGSREPELYGSSSLADTDRALVQLAGELGAEIDCFQSNHEGEILDRIHESLHVDGFLVNPGGLGHSSVCLRDALLGVNRPFVEVHCTNIHAREEFRHRTLLSDVAAGVVSGFGWRSYLLGLRGLVDLIRAA